MENNLGSQNLKSDADNVRALKVINFEIKQGEWHGIIGKNYCVFSQKSKNIVLYILFSVSKKTLLCHFFRKKSNQKFLAEGT